MPWRNVSCHDVTCQAMTQWRHNATKLCGSISTTLRHCAAHVTLTSAGGSSGFPVGSRHFGSEFDQSDWMHFCQNKRKEGWCTSDKKVKKIAPFSQRSVKQMTQIKEHNAVTYFEPTSTYEKVYWIIGSPTKSQCYKQILAYHRSAP